MDDNKGMYIFLCSITLFIFLIILPVILIQKHDYSDEDSHEYPVGQVRSMTILAYKVNNDSTVNEEYVGIDKNIHKSTMEKLK